QERKKYLKAGQCFEKMARSFPNKKRIASVAIPNAASNYSKAGEGEKALELSNDLLTRFPRSKYAKKTLLVVASTYRDRANFKRSAEYYEQYAREYASKPFDRRGRKIQPAKSLKGDPTVGTKHDFFLLAATLREAMGDHEGAMKHYVRILRQYKRLLRRNRGLKREKRFVGLYMKVAKNYKNSGKSGRYRYTRMMKEFIKERYGTKAQRIHARMEYAMMRKKSGFRTESEKERNLVYYFYKRLPSQEKKNAQVAYAVAHARFIRANKIFAEYKKIRVQRNLSQAAQKVQLKRKRRALKKTKDAFTQVAKFNHIHWIIASNYVMGEAFLDYARFMVKIPPPKFKEAAKKVLIKQLMGILKKNGVRSYNQRKALARKILYKPQGRAALRKILAKIRENYQATLQKNARPIEDKAVSFYEQAMQRAHRGKAYNKWTARALARLQQLRPQKYPKYLELRPEANTRDNLFKFSNGLLSHQNPSPAQNKKKKAVATQSQPQP
ncbi:MAG: hypothetical protein AAGJ35_03145, partial [Myxococcota bacterium]